MTQNLKQIIQDIISDNDINISDSEDMVTLFKTLEGEYDYGFYVEDIAERGNYWVQISYHCKPLGYTIILATLDEMYAFKSVDDIIEKIASINFEMENIDNRIINLNK